MNTIPPELQQAIEQYHSAFGRTEVSGVASTYISAAHLIRTDGTIIQKRGGIINFWKPYISLLSKKSVLKPITLLVNGATAHELCDYHFAIGSNLHAPIPHETIGSNRHERGHYLAVWRLVSDPVDGDQWRIEMQAFCSSDRLMLLLSDESSSEPDLR
jgi:hypothetical protein